MSNNLNFAIGVELDELSRDLKRASGKIEDFTKRNEARFQRLGQKMTQLGKGLSVAVTLPLLALGAASVKAASDAEETESKFNVVFSNIAASAKEAQEELRNQYGLSRMASQQLLGDTGDLLTGFGFTQTAALDLASEVNKLAVDLASFTNFSGGAAGASAALTKALLGERESVKSLGISILEADVQAKVLENTQKGLTFETERQAKAFATLQIAQEQSKNAIGDYARTSDSFANKTRLLKARLSDLSVEFGKILLPAATKLVSILEKVIDKFSSFEPATKKMIVVVGAVVAAIGPFLLILGKIIAALPAIKVALVALTGPVGLIIAAIVALTAIIIKNWDTVKQWAQDLANWFIDLYNESLVFRAGIEALALNFKNAFAIIKFIMQSLWTIVKAVVSNVVAQFKLLGAIIKAAFTLDFDELKRGFVAYEQTMLNTVGDVIDGVKRDFNKLTDTIVGNVEKAINNVVNGKIEPVKFEASKESLTKLKDDTADAVALGVKEGLESQLSGKGRQSVANTGIQTGGTQQTGGNLQSAETGILEFLDEVTPQMAYLNQLLQDFDQQARDLIFGSISDTFEALGDTIGNALASGASVIEGFGKVILVAIGNFLSDFGGLLIKYALAAEAFNELKESIITGNKFAVAGAIAAGIALKIAGSAIASQASRGVGGGGGASASTPNINTSQSFAAGGRGNEFVFRISGRDLVTVIDRNRNNTERIGG